MTGLRDARFDDHWRRVTRGDYPNIYRRLEFSGLRGFQDGAIEFNAGVSVIVGGNGVGKSTLAAALAELVCPSEFASHHDGGCRLNGSNLHGVLLERPNERHAWARQVGDKREVDRATLEAEYVWLEPAALAMRIRFAVLGDSNFSEVLSGAPTRQMDADDLAIAGYLVGRTYSAIEVLEISEYDNLERFPYLQVTSDGTTYGSEAMGLGELCLLLTLWKLQDIGSNGVLILEEPENHVSPRSQAALANVLARASDKKRLWVIAVTHSPVIANRVALDHTRLVTRDTKGSLIISMPTRTEVSAVLGDATAPEVLALAEDEVGKRFLSCLLAEKDLDLCSLLEIEVAGGESSITAALRSLPKPEKGFFSVIGVYDGDQRTVDVGGLRWPRVFLPGNSSPEGLLRAELVAARSAEDLGAHFGRTRQQMVSALDAADGLDDHDWLRSAAGTLGMSGHDFTLALTRLWLSNPNNFRLASQLVTDLRAAVGAR